MADPLVDPRTLDTFRLPSPIDALRVVSDPGTVHLGTPGAEQVRVRMVGDVPVLEPVGEQLQPGDTYIASVLDWSALLAGYDTGGLGNAAKLADRLSVLAKGAPLFGPLSVPAVAWDVPQPQETPVVQIAHTLCTWRGIFGTAAAPSEQWSFSLKCAADPTPQTQPVLDAAAAALSTAYQNNMRGVMAPRIVLTETIYARVDAEGRIARFPDLTYQQGKNGAVIPGNADPVAPLPLQTALVVTLDTTRPGPTGKGRVFLPYQGPVTADFLVPVDTATQAGTAVARLILDVNAILGDVSVISSKGYATPVVRVRTGRAPDTMRSRRADLAESYVAHAIAP